jgi:hypothetical protein
MLLTWCGVVITIPGSDTPDTLRSRNNLATAYVAAGRTDDAIPLLRQVLATREKVLGPDDPDTQASRRMLEEVNSQVSRSSEA